MNAYEEQRQAKITRNKALIQELGIPTVASEAAQKKRAKNAASSKIQKRVKAEPSRSSARIAAGPARSYNEDEVQGNIQKNDRTRAKSKATASRNVKVEDDAGTPQPPADISQLQDQWTSWTPEGSEPTRDDSGTIYFADAPSFTPNKTPEEIIREGAFGGSYFRPYYSSHLRATIDGDWQEVPESWTHGLDVDRFLRSEEYDPEINKFKVACGQSLEAWEAAGWMNHDFDVRGWFQWYMRFYLGRRCDDDDRQIGRWARCVGERGRWKRTLLKQYLSRGIRSVFDDGDEQEVDVSPVVSQTCHHWAYEVKQEDLDHVWAHGL